MHALQLVALKPIAIGVRTLSKGEPLARLEFASEEEAKFFQSRLRWSAFMFVNALPASTEANHLRFDLADLTNAANGEQVIVADLFDLLAGAKPEELAELKGIGLKAAATIIENAQAFVSERAEAKAKADAPADS